MAAKRGGERTDGWLDVFDSRRESRSVSRISSRSIRNPVRSCNRSVQRVLLVARGRPDEFAPQQRAGAGERHRELGAGIAKTSEMLVSSRHGQGRRRADDEAGPRAAGRAPRPGRAARAGARRLRAAHEPLPDIERVNHKFGWMLFNQKWQPWYGLFSRRHDEPVQRRDVEHVQQQRAGAGYMWWLQFMRTGDPKV